MATYAPSFGDRPPQPPDPNLRDDDDDGIDDFVVKLTTEDNPYPRWFAVPPELIDMLADE